MFSLFQEQEKRIAAKKEPIEKTSELEDWYHQYELLTVIIYIVY